MLVSFRLYRTGAGMLRWVLFVFSLLLIATGLALPLWATFAVHHFSDEEITPFNIKADLSGKETQVGFTALHTGWYDIMVVMPLPLGTPTSEHGYSQIEKHFCCLLRSPNAKAIPHPGPVPNPDYELDCRATPGKLQTSWIVTDGNDKQQKSDDNFDNVITRGSAGMIDVERYLGTFSTQTGHRYVLRARIKSDDPTIKRLKPHLTATIATTGILESIALTKLITFVAWGIFCFFLVIGIPVAIAASPRKRVL